MIDYSRRFSQLCENWREVLIIVKPETVIKWHRQGFKLGSAKNVRPEVYKYL